MWQFALLIGIFENSNGYVAMQLEVEGKESRVKIEVLLIPYLVCNSIFCIGSIDLFSILFGFVL